MLIPRLSLCLLFLSVFMAAAAVEVWPQQAADLYTVTSSVDSHDAVPGDHFCSDTANKCTLRAAIEEANADPVSRDVIVFNVPTLPVIDLTLGELPITGNVAVIGPGARNLTVERSTSSNTPLFRVFHVSGGLSSISIRGLKIRNGRSPVDTNGAGVLIDQGSTVTLSDLWIEDNFVGAVGSVTGSGGGVFNSGDLRISRCLFLNNSARIDGAALGTDSNSTATISNSTFTGNTSIFEGTVHNTAGAILLLVNDTFYRNPANGTASAVANFGTTSVLNTLFADPAGPNFPLSGTFVSFGNNVVVNPDHSTGFVDGVNGDQVGNITDPHVAADAANNGGQTDTFSLLPGSPAIDHGNPCIRFGNCSGFSGASRTDQRSFLRSPVDTPDVGAFETSAFQTNGNFGSFTISTGFGGPRAKNLGSIGVLTDPVTNQKYYTVSNAQGSFYFRNVPTNFVLEIKSKRQGFSTGPIVFFFDDIAILSGSPQAISLGQGVTATVTATPAVK